MSARLTASAEEKGVTKVAVAVPSDGRLRTRVAFEPLLGERRLPVGDVRADHPRDMLALAEKQGVAGPSTSRHASVRFAQDDRGVVGGAVELIDSLTEESISGPGRRLDKVAVAVPSEGQLPTRLLFGRSLRERRLPFGELQLKLGERRLPSNARRKLRSPFSQFGNLAIWSSQPQPSGKERA